MIDSSKLTDEQLDQLAAQKLAGKQAVTGTDISDEQLNMLAAQKLAEKQTQPQIDNSDEASLGFANRAKYSIEPLSSNRRAFLEQQFPGQVKEINGELYLNQQGKYLPVNKSGFSVADAADIAGSLPELAGGVVGKSAGFIAGLGTAGTMSVPAAMGLGAAGGLVGEEFRRGISSTLGVPQVAGQEEILKNQALSAGMGAAFGGGAQAIQPYMPAIKTVAGRIINPIKDVIGKAASAAGEEVALFGKSLPGGQAVADTLNSTKRVASGVVDSVAKRFEKKVAPDAARFFEIADRHGIDKTLLPESVEFGKNSAISRDARVIAEGPLGQRKLENFYEATAQVNHALDNAIGDISPQRLTSPEEAGQHLIKSLDDAKKDFFGNLNETYGSIVEKSPGAQLSEKSKSAIQGKLSGVRKFALGRTERGIGSQVQEGKSLLQAVKNLENSNGSLKQTVESLQNIGEEAFKTNTNNRLPIDKERLQSLYFDVQKEVLNTIRDHHGDDVADSLIRNNKMITDFLSQEKNLIGTIGKEGIAPEKVFQTLIERGDTKKIEALMSLLPPEKLQPLKASLLDSLVKRNAEGNILYDSTAKALREKGMILNKLFTAEELEPVKEVIELGQRMGDPIMSKSGTGASNEFNKVRDIIPSAVNATKNETTLELNKNAARQKLLPKSGRTFPLKDLANPASVGNATSGPIKRDITMINSGGKFVRTSSNETGQNRQPGSKFTRGNK